MLLFMRVCQTRNCSSSKRYAWSDRMTTRMRSAIIIFSRISCMRMPRAINEGATGIVKADARCARITESFAMALCDRGARQWSREPRFNNCLLARRARTRYGAHCIRHTRARDITVRRTSDSWTRSCLRYYGYWTDLLAMRHKNKWLMPLLIARSVYVVAFSSFVSYIESWYRYAIPCNKFISYVIIKF